MFPDFPPFFHGSRRTGTMFPRRLLVDIQPSHAMMWSHHRTTIGLFSDKAYIAWFSASHNPPTSLPLLSANGVYFLGHWWIYVDSSIIDGAWGLRSQQFLHYLFRGLWNLTILRLSCAGEPDVITKYRKNGIWYQSKNISSIDCTSWLTLESIPVVGKISKSWEYLSSGLRNSHGPTMHCSESISCPSA